MGKKRKKVNVKKVEKKKKKNTNDVNWKDVLRKANSWKHRDCKNLEFVSCGSFPRCRITKLIVRDIDGTCEGGEWSP